MSASPETKILLFAFSFIRLIIGEVINFAESANVAPLNNKYMYIPIKSGVALIFSSTSSLALSVAKLNNTDIDRNTSSCAPIFSSICLRVASPSIGTSSTEILFPFSSNSYSPFSSTIKESDKLS